MNIVSTFIFEQFVTLFISKDKFLKRIVQSQTLLIGSLTFLFFYIRMDN